MIKTIIRLHKDTAGNRIAKPYLEVNGEKADLPEVALDPGMLANYPALSIPENIEQLLVQMSKMIASDFVKNQFPGEVIESTAIVRE